MTVYATTGELKLFVRTRAKVQRFVLYVGEITDLAVQTIQQMWRGPIEKKLVIAQLDQVGVRSLSIVIITSAFIGMVLALQTAYPWPHSRKPSSAKWSRSRSSEWRRVLMSLMGGRVGQASPRSWDDAVTDRRRAPRAGDQSGSQLCAAVSRHDLMFPR